MHHSDGIGSPTRRDRTRRWIGLVGATVLAGSLLGPLANPGSAVETDMAIDRTSIDFGSVAVGSTSSVAVILTNTGGDPFGPINIFGGAPPTAQFNASQNCQGNTLAAGGSCMITYAFTPPANASYSDTSSFTISETPSQSEGESFTVTLAGVGGDATTTTSTTTTTTTTTAPTATTAAPGNMGGDGDIAEGQPATTDTTAPEDAELPGAEEAAADSDDDGSDSNLILFGLVILLVAGGAFFLGRIRRPAASAPDDEPPPEG